MNKGMTLIGGLGLGAGLMYLLDPDRGRRRRALVRDKVIHSMHKTADAIDAASRDLGNRAAGLLYEVRNMLAQEDVSDPVLEARVRSKLGAVVSHPSAIEVRANQGHITLSGPVLAREVENLIFRVSSVQGVTGVENRLEPHETADNVPGLQGGVKREGGRFELMQVNWSPSTRMLMGALGSGLTFYGVKRRGLWGTTLSTLGFGMLLRGLTNQELKRLVGVGAGRRAVDIQKTINIAAPVERVFQFWTNYENFPRFMTNVREVRDLGDRRSHWVVEGPTGASFEWDAIITRYIPNEVLAWKSLPGATVANAGIVYFRPNPDGTTTVDVKLSYNPPAGTIGHGVATVLGSDPKTQMDEDLMRMKTLIETGRLPHDAAQRGSSSGRESYSH